MTRRALLVAAAFLLAFQVADVLSTHAVLHRGGVELNPLAKVLLVAGWLLIAKMAIGLGLFGRFARLDHPSVPLVCTTWAVVGMYFAVALGNFLEVLR